EWKEFPELTIIVENVRELNEFINNPNHEAYCDRIREGIQSLVEYDDNYFEEKSLYIKIFRKGCKFDDVAKMVIENGVLTITMVDPQYDGTSCPGILYEGMQVISIDKKVLGDVQTIQIVKTRR
ncbi:MAG: hypothetical protein K2N32_04560, partial [Clostridia bacterium]|nr:hypothetical protein [Clostridia bacterium]